jgi:hypothetical protein
MTKSRSSRVNYRKLVSGDTFLADYLSYMEPLETPHAYDFWTGCYLISNAVGRAITVDRGGAPVYLNSFILLIAESGVTRKSTAVRHATKFVRELAGETLQLIESKITPEALEERLAKQGQLHGSSAAAISISELVTFMGREKYVSTMPTLLTDLYDCAAIRGGGGSIAGGSRDLVNIFVSFLSASTPSWLIRAVNPDVIEGGFTSRVMFICAEEPKRRSPWPEAQDEFLASKISDRLIRIRARAQEVQTIQISEGGRKAFERWYKTRTLHRDAFRSSFQSREDAHILRLAAFLCINDDTWVIQHSHVLSAIKAVTEIREDGAAIFEGTGTHSREVVGLDRIRDKLLAAGTNGAKQSEIVKACSGYLDAKTMRAALDIMHELGMLTRFDLPSLGAGRPATIWRATPVLASSNALDRIIEKQRPQGH